jgi:hypothetical protein
MASDAQMNLMWLAMLAMFVLMLGMGLDHVRLHRRVNKFLDATSRENRPPSSG